jgi:endogenous inhibitor of DNA gyrase (YacG/DUF329 family)
MRLFGPREPCPHCGKKVPRPKDPAQFFCSHCGQPGPWASPQQVADWQKAEAERQRLERLQSEARQRYADVLAALASGTPTDATQLLALAARTGLTTRELATQKTAAFTTYVQQAAGDDILTPEEESHVQELVRVLGIDLGALFRENPDLGRHVMVAEANGGVLREISSSRLMQKKGEVLHLELQATLLKDVTIRQSQGGYSGFSFPIGKTGIRYRVGGYRGQSVEVGTKRVPTDNGYLVISSQRAVFLGNKKTLDLPYAKLENLTVFSDGVQFHQSNRQTAPVFVVSIPDVVAAYIHTAAQRLNA